MTIHNSDLREQTVQRVQNTRTGVSWSVQALAHFRFAINTVRSGVSRLPILMSGTILTGSASVALAQGGLVAKTGARLFSSGETITYSLFVGMLSATLFSVVWLVRQRGNIEAESSEYRKALAEIHHKIAKYEALISDKGRCIVIWGGAAKRPELLGQLPVETGAPQVDHDFLAFGCWLKPSSASHFEKSLEKLRSHAQSFDLTIETQRSEVIEVQGRVSGGNAFARFVALNNLRAELAKLQMEHERLSASVSTFQELLNSIEQPIWRRNDEGELIWVNHAYAQAVDACNAEQAVREKRELLNTVTRQKIRAAATPKSPYQDRISTVVFGNRTFFDVVDIKTAGGSAGIAIDATEAEAIGEKLKRVLKSHAETLDHLATPVAIFDGQQRLQFYNQAFATLWGLDLVFLESGPDNSELLDRLCAAGKLPEQLNWKNWKEMALSVYRSLDTKTDLWHLPNGETLRVIATAHPQGGATWVFENLTEQVDLQIRYNTLVKVQGETIDHLAEGVAVFGADGRIRLSNPAFRSLWGVTAEQAETGTHIRAIEIACAQSYDRPDGWRAFSQFITSFDDERLSRQGTLELLSGLVLDYAVIPLPDAQTMLTFVNMTDSVRAERALKEKNDALLKADELKNDFVQYVSYELRSPLTNIIGFTDLLKTPDLGHLTKRQAEYLDHISTSSSVLLTVVNDILDLATVDAGIMQLNYSENDLNELLEDVSVQIADRLQESRISLEIVAPAHLGSLVADHQRLKQILIKLLTNAIDFAPEGSSVQLSCQRSEGDFLFSVTDEGPGIPEDMLKTVFDRFETRGNSGRRTGAGLGLSIVKSFVSLHHGTVSIGRQAGKGTIVTCRIPSGTRPYSIAAE